MAKKLGLKIYITAEINENQVPSKFEVGDGVIYNNYLNAPLQPKSSYLLHVRGKTILPEVNTYQLIFFEYHRLTPSDKNK